MRYNKLVNIIRKTLEAVLQAIKGLVLMSEELEEVVDSMLLGRVPTMWKQLSYPSLKPLAPYITDLIRR